MRPYVIKSISDQDTGKILKTTKPKVTGQPISEETAKQVRDYLETVISAKKRNRGKNMPLMDIK